MYKYLLFLILSIAVNGCALSGKSINKKRHEKVYAKTVKFTAKMIKDIQARRAKFLKHSHF